MNRDTLRALLDAEGVAEDQYELDGGFCDECLCMEELSDVWHVFYAERGLRSGEREFDTEDDACQFMAQRLLADPSTRKRG
jgi:hypothetical protein